MTKYISDIRVHSIGLGRYVHRVDSMLCTRHNGHAKMGLCYPWVRLARGEAMG